MAELAWYEKECFDLDFPEYSGQEESVWDDIPEKSVASTQTETTNRNFDSGVHYPIDVWFNISSYITPEDIGRFAGICHATLSVVYSAKFWINLYKRYYHEADGTPSWLKPDYVLKVNGLRCRVIRSMFHLYFPFKASITCKIPFKHDSSVLHDTTCTLMWHRTAKTFWQFYFKFQKPHHRTANMSALVADKKRLLSPPDVHLNPEEGCCVLEITSQNFISIPHNIMGQSLRQSFLSVGHDMRYYKLKLVFADIKTPHKRLTTDSATTIALDPVVNFRVLHWWHPHYPC